VIVRIPERRRERPEEIRLLERQLERAELYLRGALNTETGGPELRRRLERARAEVASLLHSLRA
jgi:hypothetical protein